MEPTTQEIQSYTITNVRVVKYIKVHVDGLELFNSVRLRIDLLDENKNYVETRFLTLSGDDYTNWMNDDTYILNKAHEFVASSIPTPTS